MTAADAPQVEPLKLTLEEAIVELAKHDRLSLRCFPASFGVPAEWAALSPEGWVRGGGDAWHEAVSEALGRPVVPRDDTAELVEFLERIGAFDENLEAANSPELLPCFNQRLYDEWKQLSIAARAALARVRSEP